MRYTLILLSLFCLSPIFAENVYQDEESGFSPDLDVKLLGTWQYAFVTYATDTVTIEKNGILSQKAILGGKLFQDTDGTMEVDTSTDPKRMILTFTRVNPDQVIKIKVGEKYYCLYRTSEKFLYLNCGYKGSFPDKIDEGGYAYSKIK